MGKSPEDWVDELPSGEDMMGAHIIDRGRGPEIDGTRITVYDVMDYLQEGWRYAQIAGLFRLPPDDIQATIKYIEDHKEAVMTAYQQILARHRNVQYPGSDDPGSAYPHESPSVDHQ